MLAHDFIALSKLKRNKLHIYDKGGEQEYEVYFVKQL